MRINALALTAVLALTIGQALATDKQSTNGTPEKPPFTVGVGVKVSTLGAGVDVSVPVTRRTNARIGFNAFSYNADFDEDNVKYAADLKLRSVQALYDIFPFGGNFHISPGVLLYNGMKVNANATVAGGQSFSLGDGDYVSSVADPMTGTAKLNVKKAAPMFLFGYGNPIPRSKRHFTFSIEAGVVFQGSPNINLNFGGSACDSTGLNCRKITTDPTIQAEIAKEQRKLRDDASIMKFYPVVSVGVGYRF